MESLYGRTIIYSDVDEITRDNVYDVLSTALNTHQKNASKITYLLDYFKGEQPIVDRTKEVRPEIMNIIVENRAKEIVDFKTGYLIGEPVQYASMTGDEDISEKVSTLNTLMRSENKDARDRELIEWSNICGTSFRLVLPDEEEDEAPFEIYTLDPQTTFVIYSSSIKHEPIMGVTYVVREDETEVYSCYTKDRFFEITDDVITREEDYPLGIIPIIEYPANPHRLGAFEPVVTLLDAINNLDSNRMDGVEQAVQQLCVAYNCQFEEGTTANTIRQAGMIQLKSVGDNKADFKILGEEVSQSETQVLKEDLCKAVRTICGMPTVSDTSSAESSNNGAVILRNGWQTAEARAKDSELAYKQSEREFLKLVLRICDTLNVLSLRLGELDIKFTRRNYEDALSKSQILINMLGSEKIDPKLAFLHCGMFTDAEEAYRQSLPYIEKSVEAETSSEEETSSERTEVKEIAEVG